MISTKHLIYFSWLRITIIISSSNIVHSFIIHHTCWTPLPTTTNATNNNIQQQRPTTTTDNNNDNTIHNSIYSLYDDGSWKIIKDNKCWRKLNADGWRRLRMVDNICHGHRRWVIAHTFIIHHTCWTPLSKTTKSNNDDTTIHIVHNHFMVMKDD